MAYFPAHEEEEGVQTEISIIGGGPAGMFLAHLLHQQGRSVVVLEQHNRDYVQGRVRAGVLEQGTVDLMARLGLDARLRKEGLVHQGVNLSVGGDAFRIDLASLTQGATITVYGQQEVMQDLFDAAEANGIQVRFNAQDVAVSNIDGDHVGVTWCEDGAARSLRCDFVAGCDGSHGVSRQAIPAEALAVHQLEYPFGWLGILADVPPAGEELVYACHPRGFALASMRSATRSRYYLQCAIDERLENWPDERIWEELCVRLGPTVSKAVVRGPSFEKSIAPLRSVVTDPMSHGRLFLAGDAAHIVPPTGAKGLNLAASDVFMLADALREFYRSGSTRGLDQYSSRALARVWAVQRFSWWFTSLTHRFENADSYRQHLQRTELAYLRQSVAQQRVFAENYVGLPLETDAAA